MSKNLKRILITGASLLMFASVGASTSSLTTNSNNIAHAGSFLQAYWKADPQDARWERIRGGVEDQYNSSFNNAIGGTIEANFKTGRAKFVHRHGHTLEVVPEGDTPGKVIRVDGHRVHSRHQVLSLVRRHAYRYHHKKHYRRYTRKHYRKSRKHIRKHLRRHAHRR